MHQHALETAVALSASETYTVSMAAKRAGVEESRLADCLARRGFDTDGFRPKDLKAAARARAE